jgi:hypothetical protein
MNTHSAGLEFNYPLVCWGYDFHICYLIVAYTLCSPLQGNEQIAERGLNSPLTVTLDNFPISAYANNHQDGSSGHFPEATSSNGGDEILIDVDAHQGFDEPRTSGEIVPVPLDDIQIHEDGPQPPGSAVDTDEVPFTDAPIVGAPFRLISFVARYVSGADLVNQK